MVVFWIFFGLVTLVAAVLFELGKNTLWGWALLLLLLVGWGFARGTLLADKSIFIRLGTFAIGLMLIGLIFRISGPPVRAVPAVSCENPQPTGIVTVAQGQLRGVCTEDGAVEVYTGIPYAKPPVGELRWKEPQDPEPWEGVRVCDHFAPMSMQQRTNPVVGSLTDIFLYHTFEISLSDNWLEPMSEDSLYLNVWKPAGAQEKLPVLFYVHGGSLMTGQPSYSGFNGESLAARGVIVVNFAYRVNVFGFYANEALAAESRNGTTGNYGLLDQIQALRWVHANIAAFGGDPDNITIAGESAGASSVNALCASPLTEGLFVRAIAESSGVTAPVPYHTFRTMDDALKMGQDIAKEFDAQTLEDLRAIPAEKLVNTRYANNSMTVDGYALREQPYLTYAKGENHEQALLQGFNVHEADLFSMTVKVNEENYVQTLRELYGEDAEKAAALYPARPQDPAYKYLIDAGGNAKGAFDEAASVAWFAYSHALWERYLSAQGVPVYTYYFTKDNGSLGSNHSGELPYFYGNLDKHAKLYDADDRALSEQMQQYYVNFVKTGDPNGPGLPAWKTAAQAAGQVLELGETVEMIPDPYTELYALLDQEQQRRIQKP